MAVRVGVGLGALVLGLCVAASAAADEPLSTELASLEVTGERLSPSKAKEAKAKQSESLPDQSADESDTDAQAKTSPAAGRQVAQAGGRRGGGPASESPDQAEEDEERGKKLPARVPWRGTAFAWDNSATTSAMGLGGDFQSTAHQQYVQTFSLGLNYFVIDQDNWSVAVAATPSMSVEITDSNTTTRQREPWFNDMPVGVAYRRRLHSDPDHSLATGLVLIGNVILPTSPGSYNAGTYLTTSPRAIIWQAIPILGKDSPVLKSIAVGASFRWDHRFGRSITPEQEGLAQPRQSMAASSSPSDAGDALTFNRFARDNVRETFWVFLGEEIGPTQLQMFGAFIFGQRFQPEFTQCQPNSNVLTLEEGECIDVSGAGQPGGGDPSVQYDYGFAIGLTFFPVPELAISAGYANVGGQLGEDGRRRNIMYSPYAQFSAGLALSLDAIYEVITGPRRESPFFLVAKNNQKEQKNGTEERRSPTQAAVTF
jgi:hypothetical protein